MFNIENRVYKVIIKDLNGDIIPTDEITDMQVTIYHDQVGRRALLYTKVPEGSEDGIITADPSAGTHKFTVTSEQAKNLLPGKYIVQVRYDMDDPSIPEEDRISVSDREIFVIKPYVK